MQEIATENNNQKNSTENPEFVLNLTDKAITKVKDFFDKSDDTENKYFRVSVEGGGCSGFQYKYSLDKKNEDDEIVQCGELEVIIDSQTKNLLYGSTVDYIEDFMESGFKVQNPQAKASCGCGISFTV